MSRQKVKQVLLIRALRELIKYKEKIIGEIHLGSGNRLSSPSFYLSSKGLEQKGGIGPGMLEDLEHEWLIRHYLTLSLNDIIQLTKELKGVK